MSSQTLDAAIQARSLESYRERRHTLHIAADRMVLAILPLQWLLLVALSAAAHRAGTGSDHCVPGPSVWTAAVLGAGASGLPFVLARLKPGESVTRLGVALCLSLYYAILLWTTGGRYGAGLYIFPALALLSFYRDALVLATAAGVAVSAQWLLATPLCAAPAGHPSWELSAWLVAETAVLSIICARSIRLFQGFAMQAARLESERAAAYREVLERTRQVEASREQYRALLESTSAVPWELDDGSGSCTYIGAQVEHQWGWPAERFRQSCFLFSCVHPDDRPTFAQALEDAVASRDVTIDCRLRLASERYAHVRSFIRHAPDHTGGRRVRGFSIDITAQKKLEAELQQAQRLESVGRLAAGIAHEINTPVQFVNDNCYFLKDSVPQVRSALECHQECLRAVAAGSMTPAEALERTAAMERGADLAFLHENMPTAVGRALEGLERIAAIVRSMKEFSHPNQDAPSSADINVAILSTLTIARNEYKYVADVRTVLGEVPPVVCYVGELNQALLNIIVNAAHAIGEEVAGTERKGLITVTTAIEDEHALISIADTGAGIPHAIQDKIFDPFFTTKEVGKGTGQGLAIARAVIVDRHGGTLTFDSEPGKGTTFLIRLPIDAPREEKPNVMMQEELLV